MSRMKRFPRPTESNDQENKSGHRGGLLLMLAVYSNPRWLSVVRGAVERLTEALGFPAVQGRSITRATDEALTNIVRHSYGNRLDRPIAMYFRSAKRCRARRRKSKAASKYSFVTEVAHSTRTRYAAGPSNRSDPADWDCTGSARLWTPWSSPARGSRTSCAS